jgi:hypothetical protein
MKKLSPLSPWWLLIFGLVLSPAQAAFLQIDAVSGKLTGATGVMVEGSMYDVQFQEGTCTSLFSGCGDLSDFTFQSGASALAASQALLDQVFLDVGGSLDTAFDMIPGLSLGCAAMSPVCVAMTPYALGNGNTLFTGSSVNHGAFDGLADNALLDSRLIAADSTANGAQVFAVWSVSPVIAVPEGPVSGLLCLGLFALMMFRFGSRRVTYIQ